MNEEIHPEIRPYLIELLDELIDRPLSMALGENLKENPFLSIKEGLNSNSQSTLASFKKSVDDIFSKAQDSESKAVSGASQVLKPIFKKKFERICYLNNYNFRYIIIESAKDSFPNVDFLEYEEEEDLPTSTANASSNLTKKNPQTIQNSSNESDGNQNDDEL